MPNPFQFTPLHERQHDFSLPLFFLFQYFNSRLYMRGNTEWMSKQAKAKFQFTPLHERRRLPLHRLASRRRYFNSHLYMRGSQCRWIKFLCSDIFQFTPLHERQRAAVSEEWWGGLNFNSRLYIRGSQQWQQDYIKMVSISIHASTWEATGYFQEKFSQ